MVISVLRSLLFTPANRPTAFEKALASGADCVCLDLEDAVPPDAKIAARPDALGFLTGAGEDGPLRALRINALSSLAGIRDLSALAEVAPKKGLLMLPKVASGAELCLVSSVLDEIGSGLELVALVETAEGLQAAENIASSTDRLRVLVFGGVDLSAELQCEISSDTMKAARARIVHAAHAAGRDVLDVPELDFDNADKVGAEAVIAVSNGFTGKAAIHPKNIAQINAAFTPNADLIAEAKRIVVAFEAAPSGLVVLDGKLIEAPVVKAMRRRLAIFAAAGVL